MKKPKVIVNQENSCVFLVYGNPIIYLEPALIRVGKNSHEYWCLMIDISGMAEEDKVVQLPSPSYDLGMGGVLGTCESVEECQFLHDYIRNILETQDVVWCDHCPEYLN